MTQALAIETYGEVIEPGTLRIRRLLPGTIDRAWAYLTDSELRRQWLGSGVMEMRVGAPFELVWRNEELENAGQRPEGFDEEHRMDSRITELDPPHRLGFEFGTSGDVTIDLEERGHEVLLTLTHRRLPGREIMLKVAAGWHAHLDVLVAKTAGASPPPFWANWSELREEYGRQIRAE
jgi:uncharacterized protein YndB with AHSA1/START domain